MESENTESPSPYEAGDAISQIQKDRGTLARNIAHTGRWYYPLFALFSAIVVWAPATESVLRFTIIAGSCSTALFVIEYLRDRETGIIMSRPAGRLGWIVLIVLSFVFVALVVVSAAFAISGMHSTVLLTAAVTFVVMYFGAWIYDRSIRAEVRHES